MQVTTTRYHCDLTGCPNVTDGSGLGGYVQLSQFAFWYHNRGTEVERGKEKHFCCKDHLMKWVEERVG